VGHHQHLFIGEFTQKPRWKQRTDEMRLAVTGWNRHRDTVFDAVGNLGKQFCKPFVVWSHDVCRVHVLAELNQAILAEFGLLTAPEFIDDDRNLGLLLGGELADVGSQSLDFGLGERHHVTGPLTLRLDAQGRLRWAAK
jgi:hypothetical protein